MASTGVVKVRLPINTHLGPNEDISSFEQWKFRICQHLQAVPEWKQFLDVTWKCPSEDKFRGLTSDGDDVKPAFTQQEKLLLLEQMIEFIAGYANTIAMREELLEESTSLNNIWFRIKSYYQIQRRECRALELSNFTVNVNERPEALYRRLKRFYSDLLQCKEDNVLYRGKSITENEQFSPLVF